MGLSNIIRRMNHYFIADESEYIPASDFTWFYGFLAGAPIAMIMFILFV